MEHVLPRRGYTRSRDRVCAEECSCRAVRESHGRSTFQGVPSRPAGLEWRSERVTSSFFIPRAPRTSSMLSRWKQAFPTYRYTGARRRGSGCCVCRGPVLESQAPSAFQGATRVPAAGMR